jgi:TetR/AcrR family transcriptional regulator, mexCD-oprJ operon repressor
VSTPSPSSGLQHRVAAAILDGAAKALAERGDQASMGDVAAASGVARATVYRYFPNRDVLLAELAGLTADRAERALLAGRVDEVAPLEGVRRAVRALVEVGDPLLALARTRRPADAPELEQRLAAPLRRLLQRGQELGELRPDIPVSWLAASLVGLVTSVMDAQPSLGREDTIAAVSDLFLHGAAVQAHHP